MYAVALYLLIEITYIIVFNIRPGYERFAFTLYDIAGSVLGLLTMAVFAFIVDSLAFGSARLKKIFHSIALLLIILLYSYHYNIKTSLDFTLVSDNFGAAFSSESINIIITSFDRTSVGIAAVIIIVIAIAQMFAGILSRDNPEFFRKTSYTKKIIAGVVIYAALCAIPLTSWDDAAYLFTSAVKRYTEESAFVRSDLPDLHDKIFADGPAWPPSRPNVFIIMVESFNSSVIEKQAASGSYITPVFNKLINDGLFVEHFYGNSVQTAKGQFATLFSVIPSSRGLVFSDYPKLRLSSLPGILKNSGYDTVFFQAYERTDFNNTFPFLSSNGFNDLGTVFPYLSKDELAAIWGWGPRDRVFYRHFFEHLDKRHKADESRPVFVVLATISNHMRFDEVPKADRFLYPEPINQQERFSNSIHLTDSDLPVFFEELSKRDYLKNSIVIITGDHSYPLGNHRIWHNEAGFYEETFRVPFLLIWRGIITPKRIVDKAFSQIDIAPTVLDLLGIRSVKNTFEGISIVSPGNIHHPVYLIQPYSGRFLGVVEYPYKYVFHKKTGWEWIYNLAKDPQENNNFRQDANPALLDHFRKDLRFVYINQYMIEKDAFMP